MRAEFQLGHRELMMLWRSEGCTRTIDSAIAYGAFCKVGYEKYGHLAFDDLIIVNTNWESYVPQDSLMMTVKEVRGSQRACFVSR
jgi:hypothetical protein